LPIRRLQYINGGYFYDIPKQQSFSRLAERDYIISPFSDIRLNAILKRGIISDILYSSVRTGKYQEKKS
jgi:hypothetical protein